MASTRWALLERFGYSNLVAELRGNNIHRLENLITISTDIQYSFERLWFWFESTVRIPMVISVPYQLCSRANQTATKSFSEVTCIHLYLATLPRPSHSPLRMQTFHCHHHSISPSMRRAPKSPTILGLQSTFKRSSVICLISMFFLTTEAPQIC